MKMYCPRRYVPMINALERTTEKKKRSTEDRTEGQNKSKRGKPEDVRLVGVNSVTLSSRPEGLPLRHLRTSLI